MVLDTTLASRIYNNAPEREWDVIMLDDITTLTFPGYTSASHILRLEERLEFDALNNVFKLETLPKSWKSFFHEVAQTRMQQGVDSPIDPMNGLERLLEESQPPLEVENEMKSIRNYLEELGMDLQKGYINYFNSEEIKNLINTIIGDKYLNDRYKSILELDIPMESGRGVSYKALAEVIKSLTESPPKKILDFGAGSGRKTAILAKEFPFAKVIGYDIQNGINDNLELPSNMEMIVEPNFEDFLHRLNFGDDFEGFDIVTMIGVAGHLSEENLEQILEDIRLVMSPLGYLIIGPQTSDKNQSPWLAFYLDEFGNFQLKSD